LLLFAIYDTQWWTGLRYGIKPGQTSLSVQLDTTSGAVLPAGRLADLLCAAAGVASPAALCKDKRLLAAAEQDVKGAKVWGSSRAGCGGSKGVGQQQHAARQRNSVALSS
jgi:hypothetical protein